MFARLPVGPAIRWLEAQASTDPKILLDFAADRVAQDGYHDAVAALNRARTLKLDAAEKKRADDLARSINSKAAPGASKYLRLIQQSKDGSWIDGFLAFRDDFEFAEPAQKVMAAFAELRKAQDPPAKEAFGQARQLFQQGNQNGGYDKYEEIVKKYYASSLYQIVKRSLDERK
jgi:hypothetical protein